MSKSYKLKELAISINSGITPSRNNPEYWRNGTIPWLKTEQLGNHLILDTSEKISQKAIEETGIKIYPPNTISIAMYGEGRTRGNVSILKAPMTTNQACCNIVPDHSKVSYEFLYYYLKTQYLNLRSLSSGVRKNLNSNDIKEFRVKIPKSLEEQQKIASVFSALDAKIELNQRINAELEAMAKMLYDYWYVQFDFPYDFDKGMPDKKGKPYKSSGGKMVWREELKREVPEGWEVGTISDFGEIIAGGTPSTAEDDNFCENGIAWITPKDLSDTENKYIKKGGTDITKKGLKTSSARLIPAGSVLLTTRAPIGYLAIARNEVTTNQGFKSIVPKPEFGSEYIYYTIQSIVPKLQILGVGSTFREISKDVYSKVPVLLPPISIISQFNKIIGPIGLRKMQSEDEIQELINLRDWLLPMLMNGQVRVKGAGMYEIREEELRMVAEESVFILTST